MTRAGPVLTMRPTVAEVMLETGLSSCTSLKALKASARNCSCTLFGSLKLLNRDRSALFYPGPVMKFRPVLPSVPVAGTAKAAGSKYMAINSLRGLSVGRLGSPT